MDESHKYRSAWDALCRSQAVIEFSPEGTILWANARFCDAMGYGLDEIHGKHHRIFCDDALAASPDYHAFWTKLESGSFHQGTYRRIDRNGRAVFLRATYNPVFDDHGRCERVLKIATDITAEAIAAAETASRITAFDRSYAVVEFDLTGNVLDANENFLDLMGYRRDQVVGCHHRIFCDAGYALGVEYAAFWTKLGRGEFDSGVYPRLRSDGSEVWVQATYNPVMDADGKPYKVVKLATDITYQVRLEGEAQEALQRSRELQSVAEDQTVRLETSMKQLSGIVATIDNLATQTTMLALNATIEAAHAGDKGLGFAVVASEVKKLAMDTRQATDRANRMMSGSTPQRLVG
ncbi:methyl-accepting chemotaxis protein [Qipengyuania spongiae]|uniref:methyl-accepting chemotaxis protein n=1 Tax=Qipengyuania spongiae TaxID=2909673 RepID=UPI002407D5B6|nr:PAS domain-containing methyl-accepting chemotaxis protein [Qipengyuania spongiae]